MKWETITRKRWEYEATWWSDFGPLSLNIYTLAGRWISFGVHLSIVPFYLDTHFIFWVISLMSKVRAVEIRQWEEWRDMAEKPGLRVGF